MLHSCIATRKESSSFKFNPIPHFLEEFPVSVNWTPLKSLNKEVFSIERQKQGLRRGSGRHLKSPNKISLKVAYSKHLFLSTKTIFFSLLNVSPYFFSCPGYLTTLSCCKECTWDFPSSSVVKNSPVNAGDVKDVGWIPGSGRSQEQKMATHSSILAWKNPWTEDPDRLQPMGLQRVGHD